MPKIVPKSIQTCFEHVLGQTFRKNFAHFSMECRVFENFQKKIFSKFQKRPKSFPKESKRVLIVIWTIFSKNFCAVFHGRSSLRKFSKKNIFKIPKTPKIVPKRIQTCFDCNLDNFFEKFLPSLPWNVESSKIFKKKCFQNSKIAQKCSQKYPNVF